MSFDIISIISIFLILLKSSPLSAVKVVKEFTALAILILLPSLTKINSPSSIAPSGSALSVIAVTSGSTKYVALLVNSNPANIPAKRTVYSAVV